MNHWLAFSIRVYRWLLQLYPAQFRHEYETEMALVFGDSCRVHYQAQGAVGLATIWAETVPDLVASVADEHAQEDFQMSKSMLTRGLAIAGIVSGALWVAFGVLTYMRPAGVDGGDSRYLDDLIPLLGMAWLFTTLGLTGIYWRYSPHWSVVAKIAFLVSLLSGLEVFICFVFDNGWPVWVFGWLGFGLCILVSGLTLLAQPNERAKAVLLMTIGISLFLFNFENWLVLLGCVAGICLIVLNAPAIDSSVESRPPTATT